MGQLGEKWKENGSVPNPNPSPATRFQLGWNGGPGRPKGSVSLTTLIKEALQKTELCGTKTPDGRANAEWLVDRMIILAMQGNARYMQEIIDRNDGKMTEKTDITSDGKPLGADVVMHFEDNGFGGLPAPETTDPGAGGSAT
jgi:hypothetical protein